MLSKTFFEKALELDRAAFKKAVVHISSAVPSCQNIQLKIKKGASELFIIAYQRMKNPHCYDRRNPYFYAYTIIHDIENPAPRRINIWIDRETVSWLFKRIICSEKINMFIGKENKGFLFFFRESKSGTEHKHDLPFIEVREDDPLNNLPDPEYDAEIQVENFSYYFSETKHALDARPKKDMRAFSFRIEVDSRNNFRVSATNGKHTSVRGRITDEIKHSYLLPKPEMVRTASLLGETVTIRLSRYQDYLRFAAGNTTVLIPVIQEWAIKYNTRHYINTIIANAKSSSSLLSFTLERKDMLRKVTAAAKVNKIFQLTVEGQLLKLESGNEEKRMKSNTGVYIKDIEQYADLTVCQVVGEYLCNALRSINSYYIKMTFTSDYHLIITDYHISPRRLPHELSAMEITPYQDIT